MFVDILILTGAALIGLSLSLAIISLGKMAYEGAQAYRKWRKGTL